MCVLGCRHVVAWLLLQTPPLGSALPNHCCLTPSPPPGMLLQVSISGDGWTVNKMRFSYFANTAARNCLAFGPGLLENVLFGVEQPFLIQVGKDGGLRTRAMHGHAVMAAALGAAALSQLYGMRGLLATDALAAPPPTRQARDTFNERRTSGGDQFVVRAVSADGKEEGVVRVADNGDGTYSAGYAVPSPGAAWIFGWQ